MQRRGDKPGHRDEENFIVETGDGARLILASGDREVAAVAVVDLAVAVVLEWPYLVFS